MSKWRPSDKCIYAIGDIHGNKDCLDSILSRITPLRKQDKVVFLGDYIDRGPDSAGVIETLCSLKEEYGDQVTCLMGNHEWMFGVSLNFIGASLDPALPHPSSIWVNHGGVQTLQSYAEFAGIDKEKVAEITFNRLFDIMPTKHVEFIKNCPKYHEDDGYVFVHAACEPTYSMKGQHNDILLWDFSLFRNVKRAVEERKSLPWDKSIVCGHNYDGPFVYENYFMLDASKKRKVFCMELNSREGYFASPKKKRLVKAAMEDIDHTFKK